MTPGISKPFLFLSTAKEIWDSVTRSYSKKGRAPRKFELKRKIQSIKQGNSSVTEYFNTLMVLWQELNLHQRFEIKDTEVAKQLVEILEEDRAFEFLAGLNSDFVEVSGRILGKEPLCSLEESLSYVSNEEDRKAVLSKTVIFEVSVLKTEGVLFNAGLYKNPNKKGETD
ncbi:uncharacterized protein LOC132271903 [Cornus florida]|uniref:uncharacterized protein LOC132271903 n=1 Tax=Cornus florida TaxID=4283 RepID=UPI0028A09E79|nr:uncharacterized protein LOC132271903 [Cornus florida]